MVRECDVTLPNVASRGSGSVTPRPRRSSSLRFHVVCFIRSAERANLGRVHADQAVCAEASNDNGLDAIDAIHAHDLCVDEDGDATARMRAYSPQRPAKVLYPRDWFGTNHDQYPHASSSGVNHSRDCAGVTGNDHQVYRLAHRVGAERGNSCSTIGPLSVLRKASNCRSSLAVR